MLRKRLSGDSYHSKPGLKTPQAGYHWLLGLSTAFGPLAAEAEAASRKTENPESNT